MQECCAVNIIILCRYIAYGFKNELKILLVAFYKLWIFTIIKSHES